MKNENAISWREYFMEIAKLSARRSKDPSRQVGCCIVDKDTNHILSVGYNGLPFGYDDNTFPWEKSNNPIEDKNSYVVHAEANAILNAECSLKDGIVYVTLFPCNECAKLLAQSRVSKIIYLDEDRRHPERVLISRDILTKAGIVLEKY